jgi:hypothetical protein
MRYKGHPVRGAVFGFLTGVFLVIDLAFLGAIQTDSVLITVLPIAGFVVGLALGWWAPPGRTQPRAASGPAAPDISPFVAPPPQAPPPPPGDPTPPRPRLRW